MERILVVDDDKNARKNMIRLLKKDGWEIKDAASQKDAVSLINKNKYDVVVTDMRMENDTSGLTVLEAAKNRNSSTQVIIITAWADLDNAVAAMEKGAFSYVKKDEINPYDNLCDKVSEAVNDQKAKNETSLLQYKMERNEFDVFLFHSNEDTSKVRPIAKQLKKKGLLPWFNEWELSPGTSWQEALERQMKNIKSVAVFIGKIPPWNNLEVRDFLRRFVRQKVRIIPVIIEGINEIPDLPIFIEETRMVNFNCPEPEPLKELIWGIRGRKVS